MDGRKAEFAQDIDCADGHFASEMSGSSIPNGEQCRKVRVGFVTPSREVNWYILSHTLGVRSILLVGCLSRSIVLDSRDRSRLIR